MFNKNIIKQRQTVVCENEEPLFNTQHAQNNQFFHTFLYLHILDGKKVQEKPGNIKY